MQKTKTRTAWRRQMKLTINVGSSMEPGWGSTDVLSELSSRASAPARWLSTAPPPSTDPTVIAFLLIDEGNEAEKEYGFIQDQQAEKQWGRRVHPELLLPGPHGLRGLCLPPPGVLHAKTAMLPTTRPPVESCTQSKGRRSRDNGALGGGLWPRGQRDRVPN